MYPTTIITIFDIKITLYEICFAAGVIACFLFLMYAMKKQRFNRDAVDLILLVGLFAVPVGLLFAMLFQSVYDVIANPDAEFALTGITFLGGLIGGAGAYLAIYFLYTKGIAPHVKAKWLQNHANAGLADALPVIPVGIVIAHAFGRLGCFFAGCCAGKPTDAWYGIACSETYPGIKVVPVQLFELIFLVVLGVVMGVLYFRFRFQCNFGLYAIAYGVWRFAIEFFRGDDRGAFVGNLSPSQFWSIFMVIFGIGYFFLYTFVLKKRMKNPWLAPPEEEKTEEAPKPKRFL